MSMAGPHAGWAQEMAQQPPGDAAETPVTEDEATSYVKGVCFKTGPPRRIGVEVEWFVEDTRDATRPPEAARLGAALVDLQRLPLDSALTCEPGGQLELSSRPADSLTACVESMRRDTDAVRSALRASGLRLAGYGHHPWHPPRRVLEFPRYRAMEEFFDRANPAGRAMMCGTASVQICLDAGSERPGSTGWAGRWRLAHLLGPVLVGAFANSPLRGGRPTGWRSTRQAVWALIDPSRTLAPSGRTPVLDPRADWASYALDAAVMCVRRPEGKPWTAPPHTTFRQWIAGGAEQPPTTGDLAYHLTTLFPPVRPRGHLELRMVDAQSGEDGWIVPVAVVTALFEDPAAAAAAEAATQPLAVPGAPAPRNPAWLRAARDGLADPSLRRAAQECFAAAEAALPRLGASAGVRAAVAEFTERHVARGRCPADDLLDGAGPNPQGKRGRFYGADHDHG